MPLPKLQLFRQQLAGTTGQVARAGSARPLKRAISQGTGPALADAAVLHGPSQARRVALPERTGEARRTTSALLALRQASQAKAGRGVGMGGLRTMSTTTQAGGGAPPHGGQVLYQQDEPPLAIRHEADGRFTLVQPFKLRRLVLSGGGAKAIVYAGVYQGLARSGQLVHVVEAFGSSGGADANALFAAGMNVEEAQALFLRLDMLSMFHKKQWPGDKEIAAQAPAVRSWLRMATEVLRNMGTTAPNLKNLIDREGRTFALRRMAESKQAGHPVVERVRAKLQSQQRLEDLEQLEAHPGAGPLSADLAAELEALRHRQRRVADALEGLRALWPRLDGAEGPEGIARAREASRLLRQEIESARIGNLTFGDLEELHSVVPGIRKFVCTGTALYRGDGVTGTVPQPALFQAGDRTTRDIEISTAACISSSLPGIFRETEMPLPHDLDDGSARTTFLDGGLLFNTPVPELIDPDWPEAESLTVVMDKRMFAQAGETAAKSTRVDRALDLIATAIPLGPGFLGSNQWVADQLLDSGKPLSRQTVKAPLDLQALGLGRGDLIGRRGTLGAINTDRDTRVGLQEALGRKVFEHLEGRCGDKSFESLDHLLHALDDEQLAQLDVPAEAPNDAGRADPAGLGPALQRVRALRGLLGELAPAGASGDDQGTRVRRIHGWMQSAERVLKDAPPAGREAFAEWLVRSQDPQVQAVVDLLRVTPPAQAPQGPLAEACRVADEARTVLKAAQRAARELFHPQVKKLRSSTGPAARDLRDTARQAQDARTREAFNAVLNAFIARQPLRISQAGGVEESALARKARSYLLSPQPRGRADAA